MKKFRMFTRTNRCQVLELTGTLGRFWRPNSLLKKIQIETNKLTRLRRWGRINQVIPVTLMLLRIYIVTCMTLKVVYTNRQLRQILIAHKLQESNKSKRKKASCKTEAKSVVPKEAMRKACQIHKHKKVLVVKANKNKVPVSSQAWLGVLGQSLLECDFRRTMSTDKFDLK